MMPFFHHGGPETLPGIPDVSAGDAVSQPGTGRKSRVPTDGAAPRKRRVVTAARKEQNRVAQALFRQRRRDRRLKQRQEHSQAQKPRVLRPASQAHEPVPPSTQDRAILGPFGLNVEVDASSTGESSPSDSNQIYSEPSGKWESDTDLVNFKCDFHADPVTNTLEFLPSTIFGALLHNALLLGFDLHDIARCGTDSSSPLHRPSSPHDDPKALLASSANSFSTPLPESLKPTLTQILIPHHPSLDLIPLPEVRDKAITLSAAMPGIFNVWELKLDIYTRGGLWKLDVRASKDGKMKSCPPWERSSWVAAPWFLEKWRVIVGEEREQLSGGAE